LLIEDDDFLTLEAEADADADADAVSLFSRDLSAKSSNESVLLST
jgi:hypothetical protein